MSKFQFKRVCKNFFHAVEASAITAPTDNREQLFEIHLQRK